MARPTKSKDAKPKALEPVQAETKGSSGSFMPPINMIILSLLIMLGTSLSTIGAIYFVAPIVLKPLLEQTMAVKSPEEVEEDEEEGPHLPSIGPVVDLEEFTVNLKDPGGNRYLRADFSLTVTAEDPQFEKLSGEALHKWHEAFNLEMSHYVPGVRDIIIAALTRRTSGELSSALGKQQLKDEIKNNVDGLFHGKRKVIRVNLENFIIQ